MIMCRNNKDKTEAWARHLRWLQEPKTYLLTHMLADVLGIFQLGSVSLQGADASSNAAVDVCDKVLELIASVRGYALARPTVEWAGHAQLPPARVQTCPKQYKLK
jgi:hypothetical protein